MTSDIIGYISNQIPTIEDQSFPARFVKGFGAHCCHGVSSVTAALEIPSAAACEIMRIMACFAHQSDIERGRK
jgi:hypothetical protein